MHFSIGKEIDWYLSAICTKTIYLFLLKHLKITTIYPGRIILDFSKYAASPEEKILITIIWVNIEITIIPTIIIFIFVL